LRVPIAIRAFYEAYLWILQTLLLTHPDLHPGLLAIAKQKPSFGYCHFPLLSISFSIPRRDVPQPKPPVPQLF